jgi:hypothetical protein
VLCAYVCVPVCTGARAGWGRWRACSGVIIVEYMSSNPDSIMTPAHSREGKKVGGRRRKNIRLRVRASIYPSNLPTPPPNPPNHHHHLRNGNCPGPTTTAHWSCNMRWVRAQAHTWRTIVMARRTAHRPVAKGDMGWMILEPSLIRTQLCQARESTVSVVRKANGYAPRMARRGAAGGAVPPYFEVGVADSKDDAEEDDRPSIAVLYRLPTGVA